MADGGSGQGDGGMTDAAGQGAGPFFMRSARLGFGLWREGDDAAAARIWGDGEVTRFTGGPFDPAQVRARLALEIANHAAHGVQYWPVFHLDNGRLAGCCGLRPRPGEADVFELGYSLCRDAWGGGLAAEAARRVIDWAGARPFSALIAGHHPANIRSRTILVALGFVYTHHELYPPSGAMEPCYRLPLARTGPPSPQGPFC